MNFPPASSFFSALLQANQDPGHNLEKLRLRPGMDFNAPRQWWDHGQRPRPHEGIDIRLFSSPDKDCRVMPQPFAVPAAYDGIVINCFRDFLGFSIFVLHELHDPDHLQLLTAYGHLTPAANLEIGNHVRADEIIGRVMDSNQSKKVPKHLHLSLALLNPALSRKNLTWQSLANKSAKLIDPLTIFPEGSYSLIDSDTPQPVEHN